MLISYPATEQPTQIDGAAEKIALVRTKPTSSIYQQSSDSLTLRALRYHLLQAHLHHRLSNYPTENLMRIRTTVCLVVLEHVLVSSYYWCVISAWIGLLFEHYFKRSCRREFIIHCRFVSLLLLPLRKYNLLSESHLLLPR